MKTINNKVFALALTAVSIGLFGISVGHATASSNQADTFCDADAPIDSNNDPREVKGAVVLECGIDGHEDESALQVIKQDDGTLVGTISIQSVGDSWPTNCYNLAETKQDCSRIFFSKGFKIDLDLSQRSKDGYWGTVNAPDSMADFRNHKIHCTFQ